MHYDFANIDVRPELTLADVNNKYIFGDTKHVINVSTRVNEEVKNAILAKGATYDWFPLNEEPVMEIENVEKAVEALNTYKQDGEHIIVHCVGGNNRSRTVVELLYYRLTGHHLSDEYKGYHNYLLYNWGEGFLERREWYFDFTTAEYFDDIMREKTANGFKDIMFVFDVLKELKLKEGYILDAFECGEKYYSGYLQAYCHKDGESIYYEGATYDAATQNVYDDSMTIRTTIQYSDAKNIPSALDYMDIPFTKEGVLEAWLLKNIHLFGRLVQHSVYMQRTFAYNYMGIMYLLDLAYGNALNSQSQINDLEQKWELLMPYIWINGNTAKLSLTYWNEWKGLVRMTQTMRYKNNRIVFDEEENNVLIPYKSSIVF